MKDGIYTVNSIEAVVNKQNVPLLKVYFLEECSAYMFAEYAESLKYIGHQVIVTIRQEIIEGVISDTIERLTVQTEVTTTSKSNHIKLYSEKFPEIASNVYFRDIEEGHTKLSCIVFCTSQTFDSNENTNWVKFRIMDKSRRSAYLRIFNPEFDEIDLHGKFILCDLRKSKYGFMTKMAQAVEGLTIETNPEITIARDFLLTELQKDKELLEFIDKSDFLKILTHYNKDEVAEPGYMIIRLAKEVSLAKELSDLTPNIDITILIRGLFASKTYCMSSSKSKSSLDFKNMVNISSYQVFRKKAILNCIDSTAEEHCLEAKLVKRIQSLINDISLSDKTYDLLTANDKEWR